MFDFKTFFDFQNQPYSFWVRANTAAGAGPDSSIVGETPHTPVPAKIASFTQTVIKAVKESVDFECKVVGDPKPELTWNFKWAKSIFFYFRCLRTLCFSGRPITSENGRVFLQSRGASLRISSLEMSDSGSYSCSAENHFGRDEIYYELVIKCNKNRRDFLKSFLRVVF